MSNDALEAHEVARAIPSHQPPGARRGLERQVRALQIAHVLLPHDRRLRVELEEPHFRFAGLGFDEREQMILVNERDVVGSQPRERAARGADPKRGRHELVVLRVGVLERDRGDVAARRRQPNIGDRERHRELRGRCRVDGLDDHRLRSDEERIASEEIQKQRGPRPPDQGRAAP